MPVYDYRCNVCGRKAALFYKSYKAYDTAREEGTLTCPNCGAHDLTRLISRVGIAKPSRDFANMSSGEMLNVLEGGNSREVGEMFQQVGGDAAASDPAMSQVTDRLLRGDAPERIERDMGDALGSSPSSGDGA